MKVGRSALSCGLAGVIAGGVIAGNLWVRWHFERARSASSSEVPSGQRPGDGAGRTGGAGAILSGGWQREWGGQPGAQGPGAEGPEFGAQPPFQPPEPNSPAPAPAPKRLPAPEHAVPIAGRGERDSALLEMIAEELPNVSADDRRVWLERVRDLPPPAIREMLRLRRSLGSPLDVPRFPAAANEATDELAAKDPATGLAGAAPLVEAALAGMQHARAILLNNLANAETEGFKRVDASFRDLSYEVLKFDGISDGTANIAIGRGVRLAATELDLTQGRLRPSANPLHVAIDGGGFFQVSDGAHVLYTRLGRFSKDTDGSIVLACGNGSLSLEPAIRIPAEATGIRIDAGGAVSARQGNDENWPECGRLLLARFANPAALVPQGDGLFAASEASGAPDPGAPGDGGRGEVKQFALEGSNVDPEAEIAALEHLQLRIGQLQRFAGGIGESPIARRPPACGSGSAIPAALERVPGLKPVRHWLQQLAGAVEKQLGGEPSRNDH